mgnify:CR=1 FL=1
MPPAGTHPELGCLPAPGICWAHFVAAIALFFALWWMLVSGGDEAPWIPAGLAASVVLLVAFSAREVVMRRAWTRYLLDQGADSSSRTSGEHKRAPVSRIRVRCLRQPGATLRNSRKRLTRRLTLNSTLDVFHLCQDYLATTDDALRSSGLAFREKKWDQDRPGTGARTPETSPLNMGQRLFPLTYV